MKMVKSLLLGSAAGLVAVSAGQAADLPVKARPAEYVKVCSLYGAGFYYMPGTDMCIKIGGWMRAEMSTGNINGSLTAPPLEGAANSRSTSNTAMRARGYITLDVREQTGYGVARAYIAAGLNTNDAGLLVASTVDSVNRGYIQWAGMTMGLAQSFYDYYCAPCASYRAGYYGTEDTGDPGWWVWAYTAQFGGGLSATLSTEVRRVTQIINASAAASATTGTIGIGTYTSAITGGGSLFPGAGAYGGQQMPDIVANIRLDQAWGGGQIMGALHEVNATYYAPTALSTGAGHPSDAWGWVVGAGLRINAPFIAPGDYFQGEVNYTQGALRYLFITPGTANFGETVGANSTLGIISDCVYGGTVAAGTGTSCQLTTAWSLNASYEHYWTPAWHQSVFGAYAQTTYNALANNNLCQLESGVAGSGSTSVGVAGCNNNWAMWAAGSRLQWDVTKSFYLGVEALYTQLNSASFAGNVAPIGVFTAPGVTNTMVASQSAWSFTVRAHKDFLP